ncbi:MAG: secretin N-terminal domain-containing protein [Lentisphaerota bacterium]
MLVFIAQFLCTTPPVFSQDQDTAFVDFNFDQVDIRLMIKLVGELTGRRFVVGDKVAGKVTVITPSRIPLNEVYPLFLTILESSGFSVVESADICHVIPLPEREMPNAPMLEKTDGRTPQGLVTRLIKVTHISAVELKKILDPMVRGGKTGALAAFGPTNHLLITDTDENIRKLERIITQLDQPGSARVVEVIHLKNASAEDIATQLMGAMQGMATAVNKINRHFQQIAEGSAALPTDVMVVPSTQANSLVLVGTPIQLGEMKRILEMLDVEAPSGYGRLNAIFLKYLAAEDAAKSLNALLAKTAEKDQQQRISIEPSIPNNALIVDASPQDFEYVRALVDRLDQIPQQVMVEILIAEIGLNKSMELGVDWQNIDIPDSGQTTVIGRSRMGDTDELMDIVTKGVFPQGLAVGIAHGTYTDPSTGKQFPQIPVYLKALGQNRDVKILSNIPLWAQNNTEASVSVVNNIPILKSTIEGGAGTARDVIQNIERLDVGIKLKLTPHVNPSGDVKMQLNPSIEAIIDEGPSDIKFAPTIAKREVSTTVTVPNEATVIISGLIREDRVKAVNKIPILGDIPILGVLFRNTTTRKERTNLLIFVTPHIVTDMQASQAMKKRLEQGTTMTNSLSELGLEPTP